jgi:hypothetical protein
MHKRNHHRMITHDHHEKNDGHPWKECLREAMSKVTLSAAHYEELRKAKMLLENPSIAARFTHVLATPIEMGMERLPDGARDRVAEIARAALTYALKLALFTLGDEVRASSDITHKALAAVSGAAGGAFGLTALAAELPVSTAIMLRSVADIARSEGEDLGKAEARLACLEVFALGGTSSADDAADTGYFAVRAGLAKAVSEAASYAASTGTIKDTAPAVVRLVGQIATRFSIPVTEKAAAQAIPIIGAAGGAIVNALFIDHFQDAAKGHFTVRRLERVYTPEQVFSAYEQLPCGMAEE